MAQDFPVASGVVRERRERAVGQHSLTCVCSFLAVCFTTV